MRKRLFQACVLAAFLIAPSFLQAASSVTNQILGVEQGTNSGNQIYSDWMYSQRLNDPLAMTNGNKVYFREKRLAIEANVNPDAARSTGTNVPSNLTRAKMRSVERTREIPLEQFTNTIVDLSNSNPDYAPAAPSGKKLYFVPLGQPAPTNVTTDRVVVNFPPHNPWEDFPGTLMHWAKQGNASTNYKLIYFSASGFNNKSDPSGFNFGSAVKDRADGRKQVSLFEVGAWRASLGLGQNIGVAVIYDDEGTGKELVIKEGMLLSAPTLIVSSGDVHIAGYLGHNFDAAALAGIGVPWALPRDQTKWFLAAPGVTIEKSSY